MICPQKSHHKRYSMPMPRSTMPSVWRCTSDTLPCRRCARYQSNHWTLSRHERCWQHCGGIAGSALGTRHSFTSVYQQLQRVTDAVSPTAPAVAPAGTQQPPSSDEDRGCLSHSTAGAEDGSRTRTGLPPTVFKTAASAIPPPRRASFLGLTRWPSQLAFSPAAELYFFCLFLQIVDLGDNLEEQKSLFHAAAGEKKCLVHATA